MTAFWVFAGLFVAAFAGLVVTLHLCEPPEYRRPMYRTPRARRAAPAGAGRAGPWGRWPIRWRIGAAIYSIWDPHLMAVLGWLEDRRHAAPLPRRRVRDLDPEDTQTIAWVEAIKTEPDLPPLPEPPARRQLRPVIGTCAAWLRLTAASTVQQAITHHLAPAAIPPTETPHLDRPWEMDTGQFPALIAAMEDQP